jgi:hypothetical protein
MFLTCFAVPVQNVEAKTITRHTIFSASTVNKRIKEIKNYYYNKKSKLTIKKQKISTNEGTCTMSYYIHGKDLMFAYGSVNKTEYRLYFYKNQLIRMLVDTPGASRKTYKQLYKKLENIFYDSDVANYMDMENYGRKLMGNLSKAKSKLMTNKTILITKVSGSTIYYHTLNCYGSDGSIWSIDTKTYKATISSNVKIEDYSGNPDTCEVRSVSWLKKRSASPNLGPAVELTSTESKITKVTLLYFA